MRELFSFEGRHLMYEHDSVTVNVQLTEKILLRHKFQLLSGLGGN